MFKRVKGSGREKGVIGGLGGEAQDNAPIRHGRPGHEVIRQQQHLEELQNVRSCGLC